MKRSNNIAFYLQSNMCGMIYYRINQNKKVVWGNNKQEKC